MSSSQNHVGREQPSWRPSARIGRPHLPPLAPLIATFQKYFKEWLLYVCNLKGKPQSVASHNLGFASEVHWTEASGDEVLDQIFSKDAGPPPAKRARVIPEGYEPP